MERYKKIVQACTLIIDAIESGDIDVGYWQTGNVLASELIITVLRCHVIDVLRKEQNKKADLLIKQIKNRYGKIQFRSRKNGN